MDGSCSVVNCQPRGFFAFRPGIETILADIYWKRDD